MKCSNVTTDMVAKNDVTRLQVFRTNKYRILKQTGHRSIDDMTTDMVAKNDVTRIQVFRTNKYRILKQTGHRSIDDMTMTSFHLFSSLINFSYCIPGQGEMCLFCFKVFQASLLEYKSEGKNLN